MGAGRAPERGGRMASPYAAVLRIYTKTALAYRMEFFMDMLLFMVGPLIFIAVWLAVYSAEHVSAIGGITLAGMIVYQLILGSISYLSYPDNIDNLQSDIQQGSIASALIRPMRYVPQLLARGVPGTLFFAVFGTAPILIAISYIAGLHIGVLTAIAFVGEMAMAYAIIDLIGFIIGAMSVYLTNIWGKMNGLSWVFALAGGGIMPLSLYPQIGYKALMLTPFPYLYYVPGGTFSGMIPLGALAPIFAVGLSWVAGLALVAALVWSHASKAINAVGI